MRQQWLLVGILASAGDVDGEVRDLDLASPATDRIAGVITFEAAGFGVIGRSFIWWSLGEIFR
ncbi:hypothetical protein [Amycolatopsis sp. cmx-11-12]|uniref:hypothetical protein n=1 Tax=Amycolatopsis sp. cmx-11-12 TaxID=2785795 RepID=UPI0039180882